MILAAGLTPAWQQIMRFTQLRPGEVNRAAEVHWCASGKVLNVGIALDSLGAVSHTLAPAGGWSGEALRAEFARDGRPATWVACATPTRVCTTILNDADGSSTELVENAAALSDAEMSDAITQYHLLAAKARVVVLTGSLPKKTPATFYRTLLERTACPVVLDVRGPELDAALVCRPRVVKPNREELGMTLGRKLTERADVLEAMRSLIERGAGSVVVTQGKAAVWLMEESAAWELTPPPITPVINPIGSGDCMAAAIALGLERGESLLDAVRLGIAAASLNVTQLLPARIDLASVEALRQRMAPPTQLE